MTTGKVGWVGQKPKAIVTNKPPNKPCPKCQERGAVFMDCKECNGTGRVLIGRSKD